MSSEALHTNFRRQGSSQGVQTSYCALLPRYAFTSGSQGSTPNDKNDVGADLRCQLNLQSLFPGGVRKLPLGKHVATLLHLWIEAARFRR